MTVAGMLLSYSGSSTYTYSIPSGGTLWGTLDNVNGSTTDSFTVAPSHTGGSVTTSALTSLSAGNWNLSKLESNWIDFGSKYWWWNGTAGSWTQSGSASIGFFLVRKGAVTQDSALVCNWVNNIERWYSGFSGSTTSAMVYGASSGAAFTFTLNQVYWVNVTYNGTTVNMYVDNSLVSTQTGRTGSASGYLSIANYYSIGSYRTATGSLYINNFKIYTGSSSTFLPQ